MAVKKTLQKSPVILALKRYSEPLLLLVFFLGSWGFFYVTLGEPTSWDELLYMDLSMFPKAAGSLLNRWAHIYLQKPFLDLAPTPLLGARLYWGFLISATLVLVYLTARIIRRESNLFNGFAAVLFFASSGLLFSYAGNTYADYTAMFFVALGILLYIIYFRVNGRYRWLLLIVFGFIFFAATKSKESGLILAVPILGFGFTQNQFKLKGFLKNLVYVSIGIGFGFGVLALLDFIFINNAFTSISAQQLSQYSNFAFHTPTLEIGLMRHISLIVASLSDIGSPWVARVIARLPLFSLLYLVALATLINGLKNRKKEWHEFFIWILPIAFLALLTLGRVKSSADRNFFPMHPLLAILAAQFFNTDVPLHLRRSFSEIWAFAKQPRVLAAIFLLTIFAVAKYGPKFQSIYFGLVVTASEILIILMAVGVRKWNPLRTTLALLVLGVYSFYGIFFQTIYPLASGQRAAEGELRFRPLAEIADTFQCSPDMRVYISANAVKLFDIFSRTYSFNVYFDCPLNNSHFTFPTDPNLPEDLINENLHSFAYLTAAEFQELSSATRSTLLANYYIEQIEDGQLVLLTRMSNN
jgi:hypothetical protein